MNPPNATLTPAVNPAGAAAGPTAPELIGDVETFLREAIAQLEPESSPLPRSAGRPRILPALCLWSGLLVCVLQGFSSQLEIWRLLAVRGLWSYPRFKVTDEAIYKRMAAAGPSALERLFDQITALLQLRLTPAEPPDLVPWAPEVFALDATTLDQVARKLPALRGVPAGDDRLLPGKVAGLFDVRRQLWRRIQYIPEPHENDKVAAPGLVADLPKGSMILADLGYFAFAWFDALTAADYSWVSRLRAKTSYTVIHTFYQEAGILDALVWLGAYRADRAGHAVRLVSIQVGDRVFAYLTNVCDPHQLSAVDIARLYGRRWDIEMAFNLVKTHLKLHLLWSGKTSVILQQVWAVLIISQILHALHLEIAQRAGVDPAEVSLALLVRYLPILAQDGRDPVAAFVEHGRSAHFIRPSRRIQRQVPCVPPEHIVPLPPDVELVRTPRHPQRKCGRGEARK